MMNLVKEIVIIDTSSSNGFVLNAGTFGFDLLIISRENKNSLSIRYPVYLTDLQILSIASSDFHNQICSIS